MKKRITFTLDEELIERLKALSESTMIPQAKLVEKALLDLMAEYEKSK